MQNHLDVLVKAGMNFVVPFHEPMIFTADGWVKDQSWVENNRVSNLIAACIAMEVIAVEALV